jgi:hypothetical protein
MTPADGLRFACLDCGSRPEAQGDCKSCRKSGPLMDLNDPSVRVELLADDDRRRSNRVYQMVWPAVPVGIAVALLAGGGIIGFGLGGAAGYAASLVLVKLFPAKQLFPYLR